MKVVFIDTNILIHFTPIDQIKWSEELKTDSYVIIIAKVVIDELDKHKRNAKTKIANRARSLVKDLLAMSNGSFKGSVPVKIQLKKPASQVYADHELDKEEADDRLLAAILEYKSNDPGADVYLLTEDAGPTLKGNALEIQTLSLDEKYRLEEEEDEVKRLKKELREYQDARPALDLVFSNGSTVWNHPMAEFDLERFIEDNEVKLRIDYPYANTSEKHTPYDKIIIRSLSPLEYKSPEEYNYQLEKYFKDYAEFIVENQKHFRKVSLTIRLDLKLVNTGTAAADDIDVDIILPNNFSVEERAPELDPEEQKWAPQVPSKPGRRDFLETPILSSRHSSFQNPVVSLKGKGYPGIQRGATCKVNFDVTSLKHGQEFALKELYLTFDSYDHVKGFQIKYIINVRNLTKQITGELNVNLQKKKA